MTEEPRNNIKKRLRSATSKKSVKAPPPRPTKKIKIDRRTSNERHLEKVKRENAQYVFDSYVDSVKNVMTKDAAVKHVQAVLERNETLRKLIHKVSTMHTVTWASHCSLLYFFRCHLNKWKPELIMHRYDLLEKMLCRQAFLPKERIEMKNLFKEHWLTPIPPNVKICAFDPSKAWYKKAKKWLKGCVAEVNKEI